MALNIGPIAVDPPVVLAPMAGVTNQPFRRLCRRFGGGLFVSEMLTSRSVVEGNARTMRMASFADDEPVRSVQLYGVDPAVVHAATRRLVDELGADHVDLNFGCPVPKVTRHGGGAALPVHRALLREVIRAAVAAAGAVPVTVKMRIGVDERHRTALEAGRIAEGEGAAAVALHARTAEQLYSGAADWSTIAELKAAITSVPVLGNGDIWEAADAVRMMAETGCDGVVIGRGCLGRPWLFADLTRVFAGGSPAPAPSLGEVVSVMRDHVGWLVEAMGETEGVRTFRKHTPWYFTGYPVDGEHRAGLVRAGSLAELDGLFAGLDPEAAPALDAGRRARGTVRGPRAVSLPDGWLAAVDDLEPPVGAESFASGG